jgi:hypothetical protein
MSTTDVDIVRLEAPVTRRQITAKSTTVQPTLEIVRLASWLRTIVHQHHQAQHDLRQLYELCGQSFDQSDRRLRHIEQAYDVLYPGTQYIYEWAEANEVASYQWLQTELSNEANTYQTFSREVW